MVKRIMSSSEITDLLIRAQKLADQEHGISNIQQRGIIKELIMDEVLDRIVNATGWSKDETIGKLREFVAETYPEL